MKKKILMLNLEFPPIGGGAGNANYYLLKEFAKNPDLETDLVTSNAKNTFELEQFSKNTRIFKLNVHKKDLHFWRMFEIAIWTWEAYWFSKRLIKKSNYDLIHCWFGWPAGIIGYLLRKNFPYIIALRGSDVPGYNERLKILDKIFFNLVSIIIWKNAKAVIALSNNLKELAEKTYNKKIIQVIYNGVELTEFKTTIHSSEFNILFVGRLIRRKGAIYLLKAFKEICNEYENCKLTIVGEGPERKCLEKYCNQSKIETKVKFLGEVKHINISSIYKQAYVFVLPSLKEAQGNATLEAMASGLPLITTNTGAAELLDGNGFIVENKNHKQIKEAIMRYMNNHELQKKHSQKSRKIVEKMSWNKTAQAYMRIYDSIK